MRVVPMKMRKAAVLLLAALIPGYGFCATWGTGRLSVSMSDIDGLPITNATLVVKTPKDLIWGRGTNSDYDFHRSQTDENGVASVTFRFCRGYFDWYVITPSHYRPLLSKSENFDCTVVESDYMYFETNTVDGLAKYNELKALEDTGDFVSHTNLLAKFAPKSVTFTGTNIARSIRLYPKRNPRPMFVHNDIEHWRWLRLPTNHVSVTTNEGMEIRHFPPMDFDMRLCRCLPSSGDGVGRDSDVVSDFKIMRSEYVTNNMLVRSGWIEFAPGCGAYKRKKTGNDSFEGAYEADTNESFASRIPFEQLQIDGVWTNTVPILTSDEYLVLRTRAIMDDAGCVTNCNYSTIFGKMVVPWRKLSFKRIVFNPKSNDTNLEYDRRVNLADQ